MYYVYILRLSNNNLYTGYTSNLKQRFQQHYLGNVKSTKNFRPLKLIHYEAFISPKDARKREEFLKKSKGKKELKIILKNYMEECQSG